MKEFKQVKLFGLLTHVFNGLLVVLAFVTAATLLNFNKVHVVELQQIRPLERVKEELYALKSAAHRATVEYEHKANRMDSLAKALPEMKDQAIKKRTQEYLLNNKEDLAFKLNAKEELTSEVEAVEMQFNPMQAEFDRIKAEADAKKRTFFVTLTFFILVFVLKVGAFMMMTYNQFEMLIKQAKIEWMVHKPYWAWAAWIIPGYNLIKPYKVFSELWEEADYYLYSNNKIEDKGREGGDLLMGLWWTFFIFVSVFASFVVYFTFFEQGAMFLKLSHTNVAYFTAILWTMYVALETIMILSINKMFSKI
jgi:hypothetical protein